MKTKILSFLLLLLCVCSPLSAQADEYSIRLSKHISKEDSLYYESLKDSAVAVRSGQPGDFLSNPIDAGVHSSDFSVSFTDNTNTFSNQYGLYTYDVFYRFEITVPMNVTMTHQGSSLSDTYMYLLDSIGNLITSNDDYSGEGHCSNTRHSFIRRQLPAGKYYIVSEGYYSNGIITTNITGNASTSFNYPSIPSSYSTDPGTAVGAMGGTFGVSATGGATYTIPIEVPQGIGGLQPSLSIVYNSQSGNGLCGYGANLVGLSAITRGPKDIYHDGSAQGIQYDADDALYLDGTRLILAEGSIAGQDGAVYNPESDPFTNVITHISLYSPNNSWFEVQGSDGMVYWYTVIQPFYSNGTTKILSWYLSRAIQPTGNYIEYYYDEIYDPDFLSCLYVYPILIAYGTNLNDYSASLSNTIQFSYETRNDVIPIRFGGKLGSMNKRLKTITCKTNDEVFRSYTLNYNTTGDGSGTQYSRLTSVTESNGNNESLTTTLSWSFIPSPTNNTSNLTVYPPENIPAGITLDYNSQAFFSGDMNGDGVDDLISLTPATTIENGWTRAFTILNLHYSSLENGTRVFKTSSEVSSEYFEVDWLGSFFGMTNKLKGEMITDFNGDGLNECILPVFLEAESGYHDKIRIQVLGKNFCDSQDWELQAKGEPLTTTADINNDGKGDLVVLESASYNGAYRLRIYQFKDNYVSGSHLVCKYAQAQLSLTSTPRKLYAADMNGNGATDLLVIYSNGYTVYWNEGNCSFSELSRTDGVGSLMDEMCEVGDFNGDGLMDFLTNEWGSHTWYFHLNNGDATFNCFSAMTFCLGDQDFTSRDDDKFHFEVLDFDGDGKSDIVVTKADYSHESDWWDDWGEFSKTYTYWFKSTGTSLVEVCHASSNNDYDAYQWRFNVGDFDGDGRTELINYGYDCAHALDASTTPSWHIYKTANLSAQSGRVISITGDFGATTSITYSTLTDSAVYTRGTSEPYPAPRYTIPLNVVKKTSQNNGAAGSLTTQYTYEGLKVHLRGRGMLGFSKTTANCTTTGVATESGITQWDTAHYIPKVTYAKTTIGSSQSQTTNTLTIVNKGGKRYFAYPSKIEQTDFDGNTVTTVRGYNTTYGYPTGDTTIYGTNMYNAVTYSDYILAGGSYHPRTVVTTQRHYEDTSPFSTTTKYSYSGNGFVTRKTENQHSSDSLATYYTYDNFGNLTSQVSTGTGITTPLTTYYTYESSHRFPERIYTSPASTVQKYTYDLWGNVLTSQDSINQSITNTVTHTYDAWGNLIRTQAPDGTETTYTRGWNNSSSQCWFILEQGTAIPWVKTWYDNCGRQVKTESVGPMNVDVGSTTTYNSKGLVSGRTDTNGNLTLSYTYTYDSRGRIISETRPGNSTVTYSYGSDGRTKTVSDNGRQTTYTYDAMGNLKTVHAPMSSTVTHAYSSNGGIKNTVSDGATWTFQYDDRGNRTSMTDPDAGTTTYTYDALGRETRRVDGRGVVFVTNYDYLGRVTSLSSTRDWTQTITHTYGTSGTGQMRLVSESLGSWTKSYVYDAYGRVTGETMTNGTDITRSKSYQYGSNGLLTLKTLPGGVTNSYTYDAYGNLTGVNGASGAVVWSLTDYTGRRTVSHTTLDGSNYPFVKTTCLDQYGYLDSIRCHQNNCYYQEDKYVFSPQTGNLMSMQKINMDYPAYFTYDNADRLTTVQYNNQNAMSMAYAANGNLTSKTDIGSYTYGSTSKPHAVQSVQNTNNAVDYNDQYIEWNKVDNIWQTDNTDFYYYFAWYGPDLQKVYSTMDRTYHREYDKFFWGDYEEKIVNGVTTRYYYVSGAHGPAGVYMEKDIPNTNDVETRTVAVMTDHLGSITALADNSDWCYDASYDVWGKKDAQYVFCDDFGFDRGFTGHEHIDALGLIDMKGRMYDPKLGRFLSPDNYIQAPDNPQNYNRYAYCLNNPLKYTDPSGESVIAAIIIGALVSSAIDYGMQVVFNYASDYSGKDAWFNKVDFFDIAVSGVVGGLTAGYGTAAKAGTKIGKVGNWVVNHGNTIRNSEIVLTSAVDITGEGVQKVSGKQIVSRMAIGLATQAVTDAVVKHANSTKVDNSVRLEEQFDNTPLPSKPNNLVNDNGGNYSVYKGIDEVTGKVKYVGITSREPHVRFEEHLRSKTSRSSLLYETVTGAYGLSKTNARIWEQNLINSISPSYWNLYNIK